MDIKNYFLQFFFVPFPSTSFLCMSNMLKSFVKYAEFLAELIKPTFILQSLPLLEVFYFVNVTFRSSKIVIQQQNKLCYDDEATEDTPPKLPLAPVINTPVFNARKIIPVLPIFWELSGNILCHKSDQRSKLKWKDCRQYV